MVNFVIAKTVVSVAVVVLATEDHKELLHHFPAFVQLRRHVVPKVAARWRDVGTFCRIEPELMASVEKSEHYQVQSCCSRMFEEWLKCVPLSGTAPRTWFTVLHAVGEACGAEVSRRIADELKHQPVAVAVAEDITDKVHTQATDTEGCSGS